MHPGTRVYGDNINIPAVTFRFIYSSPSVCGHGVTLKKMDATLRRCTFFTLNFLFKFTQIYLKIAQIVVAAASRQSRCHNWLFVCCIFWFFFVLMMMLFFNSLDYVLLLISSVEYLYLWMFACSVCYIEAGYQNQQIQRQEPTWRELCLNSPLWDPYYSLSSVIPLRCATLGESLVQII